MVFEHIRAKLFKKHESTSQQEPELLVTFNDDEGQSGVSLVLEVPSGSRVPPDGWEELFRLVMKQVDGHEPKSKKEGTTYAMEASSSEKTKWGVLQSELIKAGLGKSDVEVPKGSEEPPEEWLQLIDQLAAHFNLTTPLPLGWARHYKRCSILQESSKEAELIEALKKAGVRRKWREKNTYTSTGERARKDLETQLNAARGSGNGKE
ncbi:MAG: hypothetical protein Q9159_006700 [Coniocarpon cinnabarinum]